MSCHGNPRLRNRCGGFADRSDRRLRRWIWPDAIDAVNTALTRFRLDLPSVLWNGGTTDSRSSMQCLFGAEVWVPLNGSVYGAALEPLTVCFRCCPSFPVVGGPDLHRACNTATRREHATVMRSWDSFLR